MIQDITLVDAAKPLSSGTEELCLKFVEDMDYEFVGGGNAVNGF